MPFANFTFERINQPLKLRKWNNQLHQAVHHLIHLKKVIDKSNVMIALNNLLNTLNISSIEQAKFRYKMYQSQVFDKLKVKLLDVIFTEISDNQSNKLMKNFIKLLRKVKN